MSTRELVVLLDGREAGRVEQNFHGRLRFTYADSWLGSEDRYPLSLSMPLQIPEHGHATIEAFLWGLLPDNAIILRSWAVRFQVSARNAFALIAHVGEDCAGAVQFVRPERLDALLNSKRTTVQWLDETEVGERLRALRADHAAWRTARDAGQFSLAGAQPKTALLFEEGRWGVPSGRIPTTHILKPPNTQLEGFPENEHFCLELARALGLPTATSRVMRFGEELAIVIERYDRAHTVSGWRRIHQEDLCQAMGIPPAKKYQNDGGPGARAIVDLLRLQSSSPEEDTAVFAGTLILNWLIAGTDAHAKNYSVLLAARSRVRLAPLYDIASVLPYSHFDLHKVKLAMKIGGKYRLSEIGVREWRKLADELKLDEDALLARAVSMAQAIPDHVADIVREMKASGIEHAVIDRLSTRLIGRARLCLNQLSQPVRRGRSS